MYIFFLKTQLLKKIKNIHNKSILIQKKTQQHKKNKLNYI
ncbi:hypothetical protein B739_0941 [Riemerella anatipestifer RA-CH-1]|uniref:Uncharacterized protein n=1 Tax=Riemerella anatipestifer RA-CH-1 TaxID=1228997 RepID=J9QT97_RIEAN|nr:hypothetical protein B739_0941 [Riemerella anatipestifer RA-CH-1]